MSEFRDGLPTIPGEPLGNFERLTDEDIMQALLDRMLRREGGRPQLIARLRRHEARGGGNVPGRQGVTVGDVIKGGRG